MANNFWKGIGNFFGNLGTAALGGTPLMEGGKFNPKKFFTENGFGQLLSAFGIGDMYSQEQMNIDAENRQEQNQIEAEQRANAEYDRRMADERAYNDPAAQAERMRGAGLNPMASVGGISSSTTDAAAPQQSTAPMSSPRGSNTGGIGAMLELAGSAEIQRSRVLENRQKQEEGKKLWIENCISQFENGNIPSNALDGTNEISKIPRYIINPVLDEEGNMIDIKLEPAENVPQSLVDSWLGDGDNFINTIARVTFKDDVYGEFTIVRDSYANQERAINILNSRADLGLKNDDIGQAWARLYLQAVATMSGVEGATADVLVALAKQLEANYLFGNEMTWKWAIDKILTAVGVGAEAYANYGRGRQRPRAAGKPQPIVQQ